jgi:hypothetical protein
MALVAGFWGQIGWRTHSHHQLPGLVAICGFRVPPPQNISAPGQNAQVSFRTNVFRLAFSPGHWHGVATPL